VVVVAHLDPGPLLAGLDPLPQVVVDDPERSDSDSGGASSCSTIMLARGFRPARPSDWVWNMRSYSWTAEANPRQELPMTTVEATEMI
jgi:hypothetical protein